MWHQRIMHQALKGLLHVNMTKRKCRLQETFSTAFIKAETNKWTMHARRYHRKTKIMLFAAGM